MTGSLACSTCIQIVEGNSSDADGRRALRGKAPPGFVLAHEKPPLTLRPGLDPSVDPEYHGHACILWYRA